MSAAAQGVPKGYKQTEVGVIPQDWDVTPLGRLVSSVEYGSSAKSETRGTVPVLRMGNLQEGKIDWNDLVYTDDAKEIAKYTLRSGDVLFNRTNTIDLVGKTSIYLGEQPAIFAGYLIRINVLRERLNSRYLNYVLNTELAKKHSAKVLSVAVGQANINGQKLKTYPIPLPPTLADQEAIASALSDADELIESLEALVAKKRQIKHGTMQELLTGQRRLPGFSGQWETKRLGEIADIRSGGTPSTTQPQFWDGAIPWCTPTDITALDGFKYLSTTLRTITPAGLKASSAELLPANSVVMTSRATIGECAINTVPVTTNQGFKNFIPFADTDCDFLYYMLTKQKQGFISLCGGSTFLEIGKTQLLNYTLKLPNTRGEQSAIAAILSDMDAEIAALEAKLAKARQVKQGMMQELLTGRIRLIQPATAQQSSTAANAMSGKKTGHNRQIEEAVVIGILSKTFGTEQYPLARKRRVKLTYLLDRHATGKAEGYLKKAAGPYNPATKYKGPEGIAVKNGYVREHHNGTYPGFVAGENIAKAEAYFRQWYQPDALEWLRQFRYLKTDELELLATVDMAMEDLRREGKAVNLASVKAVIKNHPEWEAKLEREIFCDTNIFRNIARCDELFASVAGSV